MVRGMRNNQKMLKWCGAHFRSGVAPRGNSCEACQSQAQDAGSWSS